MPGLHKRKSTDGSCQHYRRAWQKTSEDRETAKDELNILVAPSYHIWAVNYNCELVQVYVNSWILQKDLVSYHFNLILD